MTLIEVIAALVILGTLLAGALLANSRLQRQWLAARRRTAAVHVADRLLTQWRQGKGVPVGKTGRAAGVGAGGRWRTRALGSPQAARLHARVVRVEVFTATARRPARVLASVDVLAPVPEPKVSKRRSRNTPGTGGFAGSTAGADARPQSFINHAER